MGPEPRGAKRLNLSQPVVSHSLERLRLAFNDPLFVRAGRTIAPTERAKILAPEISEIIGKLIGLAEPETLNLKKMDTRFCLSANDFERQLIAPDVLNRMLIEAPNTCLRLIPANETYIDDLREPKVKLDM